MKKTSRIFAMAIAIVMICSMLPVATFATVDDLDLNTYYTGAEFTSSTVTIDGVVNEDDGYVDLTPDGVPMTLVNQTLEGSTLSSKVVTEAAANPEHDGLFEEIVTKYYVAQDDENVYLAIVQSMPEVTYTVDGVSYSTSTYVLNNLRLGFNPADYTQQIAFYSDGFWVAKGSASTKYGVTYNGWIEYPFIVTGLADNETFNSDKAGAATDIIADYVDETSFPQDSRLEVVKADGVVTRTYELKLNKEAIAAEYDAVFGSDVDFGGMWIGMSSTDYQWANNDDNYSLLWVTGNIFDDVVAAENEVNTFVPDMILFTEAPVIVEPESTEAPTTNAPATDAPTTDAPATEAPATEAPAAEEKGCGGSVSVAGLALVAALGTCTVFVAKKKED